MKHTNWTCPKCSHTEFEAGEMRAAGSGLASIFDFEDRKFTSVTCARCSYTEFYRVVASVLAQIFDSLAS